MQFCSNCGARVNEGARFCESCGTPIAATSSSDDNKRQQKFTEKIYNCPNCGDILDSFTGGCPSCGYGQRGAKVATAASDFIEKIERIESQRTQGEEPKSLIAKLYGSDGNLSSTDEQKVSLIRNYPVPNTKEDVLEFMILASSNIDFKAYGMGDGNSVVTASQREISNAWLAKMEQAYEKANLIFGDKPEFDKIESIYTKVQKKLKKKKTEIPLFMAGLFGFLIIMMVIAALLTGILGETESEVQEMHLDNWVEKI